MVTSGIRSKLIKQLQTVAGEAGWFADAQSTAPYIRDWQGMFEGRTPVVLRPANTKQVSEIVKLCADADIAIVAQGGNTGLVGGAIPDQSNEQVVVSLERMNRVYELDADNYTITVGAGCILANIQEAAEQAGLYFPLSLGAEGSCQIGGNLSTNAGGTAVLHYGNTRDLTLGLEVVLPDGRIWNGLRRLRKNNTGYDLRHLFIGAEGTLGIITAAVLKLFPQPASTVTAMAALPGLDAAVSLLGHLRRYSGDLVTGFEYLSGSAIALAVEHIPACRPPLTGYDHTALIELAGGAPGADLAELLENALSAAFETGLVEDAVIASNLSQRDEFWKLREHHILEAEEFAGGYITCDTSVPVSSVPEFVLAASDVVAKRCPGARVVSYGHIGDGNIHFDMLAPANVGYDEFVGRTNELAGAVYDVVQGLGGSFSAEHGIGQLKIEDMRRYRETVDLDLLRAIKHAFDPRNLMNPGKMVPDVVR